MVKKEEFPMDLSRHYPFAALPLPYAYDALEPVISAETLHWHHDKHYQGYVDKLNQALKPYPEFHDWSLTELLKKSYALPYAIQTAVSRNAGGVYNHELYFSGLDPARRGALPADDALRQTFAKAAMEVFGSGYAALCRDAAGSLLVLTTPNQCTVLPLGYEPLLLCDVWEHAYYLDVKAERQKYVDGFLKLVFGA